jgi:hypothetical protein
MIGWIEQPLVWHLEVPNSTLLNDPANPVGLSATGRKAFPSPRFFSFAFPFFDKEYLEDVCGKRGVGRDTHEAPYFFDSHLKARFVKGSLIVDNARTATERFK